MADTPAAEKSSSPIMDFAMGAAKKLLKKAAGPPTPAPAPAKKDTGTTDYEYLRKAIGNTSPVVAPVAAKTAKAAATKTVPIKPDVK